MRHPALLLAAMAGCVAATDAAAQAKEAYFGRYGTMCGTPDVTGAGKSAGPDKQSPVDPASQVLLDRFVRAAAAGKPTAEFLDRAQLPDHTIKSCVAAIAKLETTSDCKQVPLYLLGDEEIRAEWLCKGRSAFMAFFTLAGGKISNIWSIDGTKPVPVVVIPRS